VIDPSGPLQHWNDLSLFADEKMYFQQISYFSVSNISLPTATLKSCCDRNHPL